MSDNTKKTGGSSLGSEGDDTTDPEKERLQMRRILVEQQQHLLSHYNHSIRNSGDDDTEDFNFIREAPTQHETQRVKTPSELSIIAQQQQCLDDIISARIEGETVLTHSDVDSERVVASKAESPVSHLSVVNPPKEVVYPVRVKPSRSTGDKPTQKHDEDRFVGEVITCGGKSKSKIEPFDQVASSSASSEVPNQAGNINMPNRTSPAHAAWLRTEQELGEYFSNIDNIESESRPNAEPKRLPETSSRRCCRLDPYLVGGRKK